MNTRDRRAWYVISLRPQSEHAAVRQAAARHGAKLLALSPWKLQARSDESTRAHLCHALQCPRVVFTSPAAVKFALALQPLQAEKPRQVIAAGAGTARALQRAGIDAALQPQRMDSEGLLALPALQDYTGAVGLVTAPGGRGLIAATLAQRGMRVVRADVYTRVVAALAPQALHGLRTLDGPAVLLLSSGEALHATLTQLDDDDRARLLRCAAVVASARLHDIARNAGFTDIVIAQGPRPAQLLRAAHARQSSGNIGLHGHG